LKRTFLIPVIATVIAATAVVIPAAPKASAETPSLGVTDSFVQDASQPAGETASVVGKWLLSWQGRKKSRQATLDIQQDGSKLTGTVGERSGSEHLSGSVQGNQVSISVGGKKRSISFTGTVEGNRMSGTTNDGYSWTATRQ
jgi:hypothetical protein